MNSGIYIVQLLNEEPMPVTRDVRYVNICAKVNKDNIKIGKAKNFAVRHKNYIKDFDQQNVIFKPIVELDDIDTAEKLIFKALDKYRKKSPKGRKLEWLEGISFQEAKDIVLEILKKEDL